MSQEKNINKRKNTMIDSMSQVYDLTQLGKFNWHIHTDLSACAHSSMTVSNIVSTAVTSGLEGIALVDHHHQSEQNIMVEISKTKLKLKAFESRLKVHIGAELSAYGIGKYSDSIEINEKIDFRLYACNHYHLDFWEHPDDKSPRAYAEHIIMTLKELIQAGRADCIAHPFLGIYIDRIEDYTEVTRLMSDTEMGDMLELGKNHGIAWELNVKSLSYDLEFARRYWDIGKEAGVTFCFGTDAHHLDQIDPRYYMNEMKMTLA